jgi:hypothetical protein
MVTALLLLCSVVWSAQICSEDSCPQVWVRFIQRGDGICDLSCNNKACGLDGALASASGLAYESSDCYQNCVNSPFDLGSESCEGSTQTCGWGAGDCGYCAAGCKLHSGFESDLGNGVCTESCNASACAWDAGDCV